MTIAGASSSAYTIAAAASGDAGTYSAVATNSSGSATSGGAVLTIATFPATGTVSFGLSCSVTATGF